MSDTVHPVPDGLSSQAMEPQASPPKASIPDAGIETRLREIPVWMVRDMLPGWQEHGATAYEAADLLEACRPYLKPGETPLQRIQRDVADNEALCLLLAKERSK